MDLQTKSAEELLERRSAIGAEIDAPGADLNALEAEARSINEELERRKAEEAKKQEARKAVADGAGVEVRKVTEEKKDMATLEEVRSSKEYVEAFARYIKYNDDTEVRALLSKNATGGQVPVPTIVEGRIRTAWDRLGLMNLVRKTYIRGNLNVGFELSASDAAYHTEGTVAATEETLTLGIVEMKPQSIKKWISISDEALDMGGEEFLFYIYDELTYRIAKFAQEKLIAQITACTASATANTVGVGVVQGTPSMGVIAEALGKLSDEAANPVIVMNKATWAQFKAAQYANGYNADPFEGLNIYYDNSLPAYTTTGTANTAWCVVGDFGRGAQANFPAGDEISIKYDDLSLAEKDLVKLVGREYIALGVVADHAFSKIVF